MRTSAMGLSMITLFAAMAFGQAAAPQSADRVFHLTQNQTSQELQEIVTLIRATADTAPVSIDDAQQTVTVHGTADQLALAAWLIHELDQPVPGQAGAHQYLLPGGGDNVVRVFYLAHAQTPQQLHEVATVIRSTADIRRVFVYNALRAVTLRGTSGQITMAEWLVHELDQPTQSTAAHEYRLSGDDVARVFYLTYPQNPQQVQEMVTLIRSVADIQRMFIYNAQKALALRGRPEQIALAEWLVNELDRPVNEQIAASQKQEYELKGGSDNQVRVFYLTHSDTPQQLQQIVTQIRTTALVRRMFVYTALHAVALRGTVGQVATAERLIEELDKPAN